MKAVEIERSYRYELDPGEHGMLVAMLKDWVDFVTKNKDDWVTDQEQMIVDAIINA